MSDPQAGGQAAADRAKAALAGASGTSVAVADAPATKPQSILEVLQDPGQQEQIALALPNTMTPERFTRICLTTIRANAQLQQCSVVSLIAACMQSAQLGLEPGILGQSYLVPFWNRKAPSLTEPGKKGAYEVQFIIGYQGLIDLFYRSGQVTSVVAREVCENDEYECEFGIEDKLRHVKARTDRGAPHTYYGLVRLTNGDHVLHEMNLDEIYRHRDRSPSARGDDGLKGPWATDFDPMARKTVIRAAAPFIPKSPLLREAMAADFSVPTSINANMAETLSAAPIDISEAPPEDEPAGEGTEPPAEGEPQE